MYNVNVTLNDIMDLLENYGVSIMLNSKTMPIQLHKLKEWFTDYYNSDNDNSIAFDNYIRNTYGECSFINTRNFPTIEDVKDKSKWNMGLLTECVSFLSWQLNSTSLVHEYEMDKLVACNNIEYNPLENYNRVEKGKDKITKEISGNSTAEQSENTNTTDNLGKIESNGTQIRTLPNKTTKTINSAIPIDGTDFYDKTSDNVSEEYTSGENVASSNTQKEILNSSTNDTSGNSSQDYSMNDSTNTEHDLIISGNIGVTTSQEMLISERNVAKFSLFQHYWRLFYCDNLIFLDGNADWNDCIYDC